MTKCPLNKLFRPVIPFRQLGLDGHLWRREWQMFRQRWTRGWDDSETWSLDSTLAEWLAPRIRRFIEVNIGIPAEYCDEGGECWDEGMDRWKSDLNYIAEVLHVVSEEDFFLYAADPEWIQGGWELLGKRARNLWW